MTQRIALVTGGSRGLGKNAALKLAEKGHGPQSMRAALAMHDTFLKKGDMRLTDFGEYLK